MPLSPATNRAPIPLSRREGLAHRLRASAIRSDRRTGIAALVALACALWAAATIAGVSGISERAATQSNWLLPAGPAVLGALVLLSRPHSSDWLKVLFGFTMTIAVAAKAPAIVGTSEAKAAVPALLALAAVAALRWPVATVVGLFALSGTFGSLEALTPVPAGPLADALLAAAWVALVWGWVTGGREQPRWLPPALLVLTVYIAVTGLFVLLADSTEPALYSFRSSAWLMAAVLLVAFFLPDDRQQALAHKSVLVICGLVGGYAMLRWAIGPAGKEEELARAGGPYVLNDDGEVRLFGSLPSPQALGVWAAAMLPVTFASALAPIGGRWRLLGLAASGMFGAALVGADSRTAMVAAAVGAAVALTLFAAGRGFAGRRALPLALGIILLLVGGGVFATTKLSDEGSSGERFRGLLDPLRDLSVQARFGKWETILDGIDDLPFGHGLGASGAAEVKYARFTSAATFNPDSSYVKVAYDQGVLVLLLFVAALLALLVGLGQRAIRAPDARVGALTVGACGALASFAASMGGGVHFEGLLAAAPWLVVGLAMAPYMREVGVTPGAHQR